MRVTFIISSICSGGAERVVATMANFWAKKGWTITLLTLDDGEHQPFYELDPAITHRPLAVAGTSKNIWQRVVNNVRRMFALRAAIRKSAPRIVISAMTETNVLTLLATMGLRVPVFVQEHTDPHEHRLAKPWELLRGLTYPRATNVVVLGQRSLAYFSPAIQQRARVIPNPIFVSVNTKVEHGQGRRGNGRTVMAMGRLSPQKGFDSLIRAFAKIAARHPEWSLKVWGEGPMRAELELLARELGIESRVKLPGRTSDPFEKLREADLFVLSSHYEGFPMALCEAMACGVPVISFDCPSGPGEIIRDGVDGFLAPAGDVEALGAAMSHLMADPIKRQEFARHAPEILDRFGVQRVMGVWDSLIRAAL
jgi:GalNAc-alpha-(1->4)-GalNAc-alpha-(1->3)-diNAcBac-PP-undecaprenol alpha-1,4-N-acetyl-D-galactosaminyltransferase